MSEPTADPAALATAVVELLGRPLLVPTPDPPATPGTCEVVEPEQLLVAMHEDDAGLAFPAFTSADAFLRWRPEGGMCAERSGTEVATLAAADEGGRLVIDPGGPGELVVPTTVLRAVLEATALGADPGAGSVLVAAPAELLAAPLATAIAAVLRGQPAVAAAHLVVIDDGSGAPGRCVAVRLADGADPATVMPALVGQVADAAAEAAGLTFTVVADDLAASVAVSGVDLLAG